MASDGLLPIQDQRSGDEQLSLTVVASPFASAHEIRFAEPGSTLAELLELLDLGDGCGATVLVTVDGDPISPTRYEHLIPAEGSLVAFRVIPQGGQKGKGIFAIIIGIGLLLLAAVFLPGIAFGASFLTGVLGSTASLSTAVGLGIGGLLSIATGIQSILAPAPSTGFSGDIPQSSQSPALTGNLRNGFRPNAVVPERFGRVLAVPEFAAKPYTEIVGTDTFQRLLFSFGIGPLTLTELKIGDTLLAEFSGVETVIHPGWDDDDDLSLFIEDVDELQVGWVFDPPGDPAWTTRTTELDAHEGSVDVIFPVGLLVFSDGGNLRHVRIAFEIQFRETETADPWVDIPATTPLGPGLALDTVPDPDEFSMKGVEQGFIARGIRWKFPTSGLDPEPAYDVRMRRTGTTYGTTDPVDQSKAEKMTWAMLRTIRPTGKPNVPNICLVEMRILMTGQLGSLVDEFNAIAERHLKIWNSTDGWGPATWFDPLGGTPNSPQIIEKTRAHSAALGHVLRATIADEYIDALGLEQWDTLLETEGRTFDATVDFDGTVRSISGDIAASARSAINVLDGKWGVITDRPQAEVVQLFTDRNSWSLESQRSFTKALHGIRVNFGPNEAAGWIGDQRIVYADGFDEASADLDRLSEINLWGVVDKDIAFVEGRYHLAAVALQPEVHTIQTDLEALVCTRGDRVGLQSDIIKQSISAGRIASLTFSPASVLVSGTFDEEVTYDPLLAYGFTIRTKDMAITTMALVNLASSTTMFQLVTPQDFTGGGVEDPILGDLFAFGELGKEHGDYLVKAIRYGDEITATLELLAYNPAIYTADTDPIPDWDPNITDPTPPQFLRPGAPSITSILSDESVLLVNPDGTVLVRIEIGIRVAQSDEIDPQFFQGQIRLVDPAVGPWANTPPIDIDQTKLYFGPLETGFTYEVRLRTISHDNRPGPFTAPLAHVVIGTSTLPPDIENLRAQYPASGDDVGGDLAPVVDLIWDYPTPPRDFLGFLVKHQAGTATNWDSGIPVAVPSALSVPRFRIDFVQAGQRTFLVKAVDRSGNESANAVSLTLTLGDGLDANVVETKDFQADGWLGTKVNCSVSGSDLHADTNSSGFWTSDTADFWDTDAALFWLNSFHSFTYETIADSFNISAASLPGMLSINITIIDAASWFLEYRINPSTTWLPWPGSVAVEDEIYEWRISVEGGSSQGKVTDFDAFVAAPDVVEEVPEFAVAATGTVTIPLTKTFRVITTVVLTAKSTAGVGVFGVYLDLAVTGPTVEVINSSGTRVVGTLSAVVKGY